MRSFDLLTCLTVTSLIGNLVNAAPSCPGYQASNVVEKNGYIVGADLNLAGPACNIYGTDLNNLKLLVEYQTG